MDADGVTSIPQSYDTDYKTKALNINYIFTETFLFEYLHMYTFDLNKLPITGFSFSELNSSFKVKPQSQCFLIISDLVSVHP